TFIGRFIRAIPPEVPKVLNLHNVHSLIEQRAVAAASGEDKANAANEFERTLRFEKWLASECARCVAVSGKEAESAAQLLGIEPPDVIPNGVDTSYFQPAPDKNSEDYLLFTGTMNYKPNIEAVQLLCLEIF